MRFALAHSHKAIKRHAVQLIKRFQTKFQPMELDFQPFFLQNDNKMTKTCAKIGGRETLKDGIVSKRQRYIVSQPKIRIVFHLFSSRFMTNDYWTLLCHRMTFTCVSEPQGSLLFDFYMFRSLCHNLATIHLLLMMFTLV